MEITVTPSTLLFAFLFLFLFPAFGNTGPHPIAALSTIYVNKNATGANDGSTWENAFANLQNALAAAQIGDEIWVAAGVYLPGDTTAAHFHITKNIQVYGGFNGSETAFTDRNSDLNLTILSGDLFGDDLPGDLGTNRSDNAKTVVVFGGNVTNAAILDGFTISGGHAVGDESAFFLKRGGGVFSFGSPLIRQCVFRDNFAEAGGGAVYFHATLSGGSKLLDCVFENNYAAEGGAARVFLSGTDPVTFSNCQFIDNQASEGGGAVQVFNASCAISDCLFSQNTAERGGGALEFQAHVDDHETTVTNCDFTENHARNGGAIRFQTSSGLGSHDNKLALVNCGFTGNVAEPFGGGNPAGGAVHFIIDRTTNGGTVTMDHCTFESNLSEGRAAAVRGDLEGIDLSVAIKNCTFTNNHTDDRSTLELNGTEVATGSVLVEDCVFENNTAADRCGALSAGADGAAQIDFSIKKCVFTNNSAEEEAGAFFTYCLDSARVEMAVEDCRFLKNTAQGTGGAVALAANNPYFQAAFRHCFFEENEGIGGSAFTGLRFMEEGFAEGSDVLLSNCLFFKNSGTGAVISCDSFPALRLVNCTLADNDLGAAEMDPSSKISFQNTIFANFNSLEFNDLYNNTALVFLGGNLMDDLVTELPPAGLSSVVDLLFLGNGDFPYQLKNGSPAINFGVPTDEAVALDLAGNARLQNNCIDAGAFESPFEGLCSTATEAVFEEETTLDIAPNPVSEQLFFSINNSWKGGLNARVFNAQGVKIMEVKMKKTTQHFSGNMDISTLAAGAYWLHISDKGQTISKTFFVAE